MILKKRGSEESFSFLIGILLMIMILTPIIIIAYRAFAEKQGVEKCFTDIVESAAKLADGQEKEILCRFQKDYVLMGFDANEDVIDTPYNEISVLKSTTYLSYARPGVCSSGSTDEGVPKKDLGCLCFCSDSGQPITSGRKCSGTTKCAQFKGIKNINGLQMWNKDGYRETSGQYWSMVKMPFKTLKGAGEDEVRARVTSGKIFSSSNVIVFGQDKVLGILIKKSGDELKICVPGYDCDYRKKLLNYEVAIEIELCKGTKNDNCLCSEFEYDLPQNSDFIIAADKATNVNKVGYFYPGRQADKQLEWITDFSGRICTYDSRQLEKKKYVERFSFLELYPESQGYTMGKRKVQLVKASGEICFLNYGDTESLKLPSCYIKEAVLSAPQPAVTAPQATDSGTVSLR